MADPTRRRSRCAGSGAPAHRAHRRPRSLPLCGSPAPLGSDQEGAARTKGAPIAHRRPGGPGTSALRCRGQAADLLPGVGTVILGRRERWHCSTRPRRTAQPVHAAVPRVRGPSLLRNRMAETRARGLLHQPGGPLGPECRDQEVERNAGSGRAGRSARPGGVASRETSPTGAPLAVHDRRCTHRHAPRAEQVAEHPLDLDLARIDFPGRARA